MAVASDKKRLPFYLLTAIAKNINKYSHIIYWHSIFFSNLKLQHGK